MNILISSAAPFFASHVFPTIVAVALSGVAMAFVGIGLMVLRSAFHS